MSALLTLSGVHTHIGRYHILQGVDFAVPEGATTMLLGRNGVFNRWLIDAGIIDDPLPLLHNVTGVLIGMVHVLLPYMVLPIYGAVRRLVRNEERQRALRPHEEPRHLRRGMPVERGQPQIRRETFAVELLAPLRPDVDVPLHDPHRYPRLIRNGRAEPERAVRPQQSRH